MAKEKAFELKVIGYITTSCFALHEYYFRVQSEIIDFGRSASKLLLCSSLCGSWKKGKFAWEAANSSKVKAVDRNLIWCKYAKHVNLSSCPAVPKHFLKGKKAISMTTVNPGKSGFVFTKN